MRTAAGEAAYQIALRDCFPRSSGGKSIYKVLLKGNAPIPPFLLCMTNCFNKHKPGNNKVIISPRLTLYHCS